MLTARGDDVDGQGFRVSVTELAEIKGVSKQAISKRLRRLVDEGRISTSRRGIELMVSLADWDTVTGDLTNPAKLAGRDTAREIRGEGAVADRRPPETPDAVKDPSYTQELTRKAGYEADLKEIEVRRRKGELLDATEVTDAMTRCAEAIIRDLDRLPAYADDLADVVAKRGAQGLREELRKTARALRETLARSMSLLAGGDDADDQGEGS